jgi:peroxiredoxin
MMKKPGSMYFVLAAAAVATLAMASTAHAAATVGQPAPSFSVADATGKTVSLADYKGKYVVLEWVNPGCPFVRKHYDSANMQGTQKQAVGSGAVWLAVSSTAEGTSDYKAPADLARWMQQHEAPVTATLMDDAGQVGRAYGARTTPHMYVVDPQGTLIYAGAIDSKPTARVADIQTATNYVKQALGEAMAGKPVSTPTTQAYGCTVKYSAG